VKGSDRLSPRQLAMLKELFLFRDAEAQRLDWAPYRVMGNESLLQLALSAASQACAGPRRQTYLPNNVRGFAPQLLQRSRDKLMVAIELGLNGPEYKRAERPKYEYSWTPEARRRLQELKAWRTQRADMLNLDPALLWPATSLERMALNPQDWREEFSDNGTGEVRIWQRRGFAEEIEGILARQRGWAS
jgi:ribonuclease D